ncbi:MAG: ATP-binding cassette domain-containing protein [Candidatus Heimdallarchaeota archaeon]|nr:ATP-binding cassette domain-containing protein [Candidatus Heimdallarchaeota archaeon]
MGYKKWFVKHILKEKLLFLVMLFFLILFIGTVSFTPLLIGDVFDELAKPDRSFTAILWTSLYIAIAGLIRTVGDYFQSFTNEVIAHKVTKNVTEEFYDKMLEKSQEFFDRIKVGDVMARATYDTRQMNIFIAPGLKFLFEAFFTVVFSVSLMIWISPKLTLLLVGGLPFYIVTIWDYNRKLRPISKAQMEQNSLLNSILQESISGIRVIRAFVKEEEEIEEFDEETEKLREINTKRGKISAKYYAIVITIIMIAVSFLWGSFEVSQGNLTLGNLVSFVMLMMTLRMPTWQFGWAITQFQIGMAASKRIYEMKEREEYVPSPIRPKPWTDQQGAVRFEGVSFSYNGKSSRRQALQNITFEVPSGETVAIIGNPGSGKSTLIKLLMRLYDPTEGAIYVDGTNIREMKISDLRDNIGAIEQDVFLFSKTIRENIAFGKPGATQEEIEHVAKLAQAHNFITEFENGYETVVGERGVTLSGGQKQRVAIARALLVDPTILILDDASSAIDAETEREIQTAIANVLKNRTTFIITHRLATIKNADLIIVLRDGLLMDCGTHSGLIQRNLDYRRLFERFSKLPPMKAKV